MKDFDEFIKIGEVRVQAKNKILAEALFKSAEKSVVYIKKQKIDKESAEHIVSDVYDTIREFIEAKLAIDGYKSYSHEATVLFLKKFPSFNESEIVFLDNLRRIRNGIKYYGKEVTTDDAIKAFKFFNSLLPKLKGLIKNEKK